MIYNFHTMGKTIRRVKLFSFIVILVQIIGIGVFCAFYFLNIFDFETIITKEYILLGATGLVFINCLLVWIVGSIVSTLRRKTDLYAAEVIGSDIQEAYSFGNIGLAVTDSNNVVLWANDLLRARHIDIMDEDILAWNPELKPLLNNSGDTPKVKIQINNRYYQVKLIHDASLWIFQDITDLEISELTLTDRATVVGILDIDNYDDIVRGDDHFNDDVTKVKSVIFSYCKEHEVLLTRIKDSSYLMICNYISLNKMLKDKFSILDKVRDASKGQDTPLTISIGIAHATPDIVKLHDLAREAIDIAVSRGGDQVVLSEYEKEMQFIGGKTGAQEKRNRVRIRVLSDSLIALIKKSSNALIMGHTRMDMDALGSCLGIKAIADRLKINSRIVMDLRPEFTENKTRAALTSSFNKDELDKIIISRKDAVNFIQPDTVLIICDVHTASMVMAPELIDLVSKIMVIDHHRRAEDYIENLVFNHIDPAASSASELVAEFIKFSSLNPHIDLPASYATIMLSGIFLDSNYFKSKSTGIRTFEASTILKEFGADNARADEFLKDDYEEHINVNSIVSNLETPTYGVIIATAPNDNIYDAATLAKAANLCMTFKGVHAAFVIGKVSSKETKLSARSDGSISVQILVEKLGGGGHHGSAACSFDKTSLDEVKASLKNVLNLYLDEAKQDVSKKNGEE